MLIKKNFQVYYIYEGGVFLRKTIHENGIPFSLKLDIPNEATASAIEEGRKFATNPSAPRYPSIDKLKIALEV